MSEARQMVFQLSIVVPKDHQAFPTLQGLEIPLEKYCQTINGRRAPTYSRRRLLQLHGKKLKK